MLEPLQHVSILYSPWFWIRGTAVSTGRTCVVRKLTQKMSVFYVIRQCWMQGTAVPTGRKFVVRGQPLEISVFHVIQGVGSMELLCKQVGHVL